MVWTTIIKYNTLVTSLLSETNNRSLKHTTFCLENKEQTSEKNFKIQLLLSSFKNGQ